MYYVSLCKRKKGDQTHSEASKNILLFWKLERAELSNSTRQIWKAYKCEFAREYMLSLFLFFFFSSLNNWVQHYLFIFSSLQALCLDGY